jgi:hypothetical protein
MGVNSGRRVGEFVNASALHTALSNEVNGYQLDSGPRPYNNGIVHMILGNIISIPTLLDTPPTPRILRVPILPIANITDRLSVDEPVIDGGIVGM